MAQAQTVQPVRGRVVEQATGRPMPLVSVSVADYQISTVTNTDGCFTLQVPALWQSDTLTISEIGYQPIKLALHSVTVRDSVIRLVSASGFDSASYVDVQPRAERPVSAPDTLLKALAAIVRNYAGTPMLQRGFYRETVRETGTDRYFSITEGLLDVYKPSYYSLNETDRIYFVKGRKQPLRSFTVPILTPGPWVGVMLDVLKYPDFLFHNRRLDTKYTYSFMTFTTLNARPVYVINFQPRTSRTSGAYFAGKLFVEVQTLAIVRAEFDLTPVGLNLFRMSRLSQIYPITLKARHYVANYARVGNRWSFHSGSVENELDYRNPATAATSRVDYVVTRQTEAKRPDPHRPQARFDQLTLQPFRAPDDRFWGDETTIALPQPLPLLIRHGANP